MRTVLRHVVLLGVVCLVAPRAAAIEVSNGDFALPKAAAHGAAIEPDGFVVQGERSHVRRFVAAAPDRQAISLRKGATLTCEVVWPDPPKPGKLDPAGWYAVVSVDVVGLGDASPATLELGAAVDGKACPAATFAPARAVPALRGDATAARPEIRRLWLKIPSRRLAGKAGKTLRISLGVKGQGEVVFDDLRLERFHDEPTRELLGKPNGKNGPDLLASGMLGFLALTEHRGTAFSLLDVREKGPAAKAGLQRSDLVVAVEGAPLAVSSLAPGRDWFERSHEAALGRAIERALGNGQKHVTLTVLRGDGVQKDVRVRLPIRSGFADTFPFDDEVAERMHDDMLRWVVANQNENGSWPGTGVVNSALAGLALLGTHDKKHRKALRRLADHLLELNPTAADTKGFSFWPIAFQGMFLSEYHLATGDKRARRWIDNAIQWLPSTTHESAWGMQAFGHSPKGLPYGQKALMAPCAHLLVFDAIAQACGVESEVWDHIEPYVVHSWSDPDKGGHGAMGYNAAAKDKAQFWSRTGLCALALHLGGRRDDMVRAMTGLMKERHPWMLNSHAYGEPGAALGLLALAAIDRQGFQKVMAQWRWRFLNAWEPGFGLRYSTPHMGAPYMGEEQIVNPAYALLFTVPSGGLYLTDGRPSPWLARKSR